MFHLTFFCTRCRTSTKVTVGADDSVSAFKCPSCGEVVAVAQRIVGFIYILSNPMLPGVVKIGFTERSIAERISELNAATGVVGRFAEVDHFPVSERSIEIKIHRELAVFRVQSNREFFRFSPADARLNVCRILGIPSVSKAEIPRLPILLNRDE